MKTWCTIVAALVLAAGSARAAGFNAGINLSWADCGEFGQASTTFACDVNTGAPLVLVASFRPPGAIQNFLGISAQIDITTAGALPDWWAHGTGTCRGTTALSTSFDFTGGPFNCTDFYQGQAAGGYAYESGFGTPNRARLRVQAAVPIDNQAPVDPALEYYAFRASIQRAKTTGTGACAGCLEEACIVLNTIQLFQNPEANNDPIIEEAIARKFVTWQSANILDCPQSTPTRNRSWGQVKSLYR